MGQATVRAYHDSLGVASHVWYPSMGFGMVLDAASGLKGGVRLDDSGAGTLILFGQGSAMTPSAHRISLTRVGGDSILGIEALGQSRRLTPVPLHDDNIEFTRDTFTLRGSFVRPAKAGRYPAVLLLNGSGPSPRGLLANVAAVFAANGVAALVYDKRGTGASGGTYTTDDFLALSEDVKGALRYLRSRADVDTSRIGILGTSQGVYTAMMVAASDPSIRFIISSSGGAFPAEQEIYRRVREVADSGYSAEAQAQARAFLSRLFPYYAAVGSGSANVDTVGLAALYRSAVTQKWWPLIAGPANDPTVGAWPPARKIFAADLGRDWKSIYGRVNARVYAVNASNDQLVPPDVARETLIRYLPRGAAQVQSRVLNGDHGFTVIGSDGVTPIYDPRYMPLLIEWVVAATRAR
ncbi:MAG: CocE/NonD family hydrolase [bacterium]